MESPVVAATTVDDWTSSWAVMPLSLTCANWGAAGWITFPAIATSGIAAGVLAPTTIDVIVAESASGALVCDQVMDPAFASAAVLCGLGSDAVAWYLGVWFFEYATALTVISTVTRRTIHFRRAITPK